MNILIIGSKGFIGHHLQRYLADRHHRVWGADVVVDYVDTEHYFLVDASNADFQAIFAAQSFDICINCSGAASVPDSLRNPLRDYYLNTVNVYKLLEAIRQLQPACKFINLSSAAVYGNPEQLPIPESAPAAPISPYGLHKLMSEQVCESFHRFFGLSTCSLRIFSAYGDGLTKQLFWDLYQKTKLGQTITLYGTGRESRDFIYIDDLTQAIYQVALHANLQGQAINVANGEEIYIEDSVATFYDLFDHTIDYRFSGQGRPGDPNNWVADISILKKLGYQQHFSLRDGLEKYYAWIRQTDERSA